MDSTTNQDHDLSAPMIRPLRVMVVASWYPDQRHPVRGSFIREQAVALAKLGHEVHVVHFDSRVKPSFLKVRCAISDGITEHAIAVPFPLHRLLGFYAPGILARTLRTLIERIRPDVIHAHAVRPAGVVAASAVSGLSLPLILTEHKGNLDDYWYSAHGKAQIRNTFDRCDELYAVSKSFRSKIESLFPTTKGRWRVCYNGIDTDRFTITPDRRKPFSTVDVQLLFLGGTPPNKGLTLLLRALDTLPANYTATIGGPGVAADGDSGIIPPSLQSRVRLAGMVSRDSVADLMNFHDVLVVASNYETFSLVCAEALACGTPVVASRCGGPEEVIGNYGELFDTGDAESLVQALLRMQRHARDWRPERAREYAIARFSRLQQVRELSRAYEALTTATRAERGK